MQKPAETATEVKIEPNGGIWNGSDTDCVLLRADYDAMVAANQFPDPEKEGSDFLGWIERADPDGLFDLILTASWEESVPPPDEGGQVTGKVLDPEGNPVADATVRIVQGNTEFKHMTTGPDGAYTFTGIPSGIYNVVAFYDNVTTTILVTVRVQDITAQDIYLSTGNTNSILEVDQAAPGVVVGGLEREAEYVRAEAEESVQTVEVKMDVLPTDESEKPVEVRMIWEEAQRNHPRSLVDLILDIDVTRILVRDSGTSSEDISRTSCVMELVIPYLTEGKFNIGTIPVNPNNRCLLLG